jgi:hypothetical protein
MRTSWLRLFALLCLANTYMLAAGGNLQAPARIEAGNPFSISTAGSGKAVLYIVGPQQVLRREIQLGDNVSFDRGDLHNAGLYLVVLAGSSVNETAQLQVVADHQPAKLSFLAKPSRAPVDQRDGISGVAYVFDTFHNLILQPTTVDFRISEAAGETETRNESTHNGVAWVRMNSAPKSGAAQFVATAGSVTEKRVIQQVPGDPCHLRMTAQGSGQHIVLQTDPVRDCSGNAVPDGTIVTFTETYNGKQSTVDVPLKRDVAKTELPAHEGAVISVATGVVMGNEIRWGGK